MAKLRLNKGTIKELLVNGRVVLSHDSLSIGKSYGVWGIDDLFVRVCDVDERQMATLEVVEGIKKKFIRRANALRKVSLRSRRNEGLFIGGATCYDVGEEVAVSENYKSVVERLGSSYKEVIAKCEDVDVDDVCMLKGWTNMKYAKAEALPRRIVIVSSRVVSVSDISDEDWRTMGVDWIDGDGSVEKRLYVGVERWNANECVVLYRYETIGGHTDYDTRKHDRANMSWDEYERKYYGAR